MKRIIVVLLFLLLILFSACTSDDILTVDNTFESNQKEDKVGVSDSDVVEQISKIQPIIKVGSRKEDVFKSLLENYESLELYNPSGDSYKEAFLFTPGSNEDLFEVKVGDVYNNGIVEGKIVKINGDSFWIENNETELSIQYDVYNDLIAFRNYFMSTRKNGMTVKFFIDEDNQVSNVWIEFIYGENNAIHSLRYNQGGGVILSLEDDTLEVSQTSSFSTVHDVIGGESKDEFETPYDMLYYGIPVFVRDIIGDYKVDEWLAQFESESNPNGRSKWEINVVNVVVELDIPKDEFVKANNGVSYSEEQIEAIYSENQKKINKVFVNKSALIINDEIYTAAWLAEQYLDDLEKIGIDEKILKDYLDKIKDTPLSNQSKAINEKLDK